MSSVLLYTCNLSHGFKVHHPGIICFISLVLEKKRGKKWRYQIGSGPTTLLDDGLHAIPCPQKSEADESRNASISSAVIDKWYLPKGKGT